MSSGASTLKLHQKCTNSRIVFAKYSWH